MTTINRGTADISYQGAAFVGVREGLRTRAYRDTRGIWTIGIGHTAAAGGVAPRAGMTLTKAQCVALFEHDSEGTIHNVRAALTRDPTQGQFDAMCSLTFNVGAGAFRKSHLLACFNAGDDAGAAEGFMHYCKAGSDPLILKGRREVERHLFATGDYGAGVEPTPKAVATRGVVDHVATPVDAPRPVAAAAPIAAVAVPVPVSVPVPVPLPTEAPAPIVVVRSPPAPSGLGAVVAALLSLLSHRQVA